MSLHLVRVVLTSGSMTELAFGSKADAAAAAVNIRDTGMAEDDHGHDFSAATQEIAALILVDFDRELDGMKEMTAARMRVNAEAQQMAMGQTNGPGLLRAMPMSNGLIRG